jgi:alcohol dehydrogenase (cytochrome c)
LPRTLSDFCGPIGREANMITGDAHDSDRALPVPRMSHLRTALLSVGVAIALAAVLSGCGSSSASNSTSLSYRPPSYSDWPYFGRDRDNTRFAPQKQINTSNVSHLGLAWSTSLGAEQYLMESFPVVVGQTIYVTTSTDEVQAINAVTGHVDWVYTPSVDFSLSTGVGGYGVSVNRGVAVDDGRLFMLTFDDHLQAISQTTGEELWSTSVVNDSTGAYETMAPTVYDGMVFVGDSGSEDGVRGFVAAYDESTGKELWRFYTIPRAGTGWVPKEGGGGTVYMAPTIDTSSGILYVGTANPAPAIVGTKRPGPDLYTDSILALQASTGHLVWYHQEVAHDLWDYDAESPPVLFDTKVKGRTVRAVAEAGKSGYLFILNAATGADLFPRVAFVKEGHTPPTAKGTLECPGAVGGSQYAPLAFDPEAGAVYVSGINLCQILTVTTKVVGGEKRFGGDRTTPSKEKPSGTFTAVNVTTGKIMWAHDMPTPMIGGATATAGGIVFTGDQHGTLYAFEAKTGKTLWTASLGLAFGSAPVIYTIDGQEYLLAALGGAALTASEKLGPIGAEIVALKIGGRALPGSS